MLRRTHHCTDKASVPKYIWPLKTLWPNCLNLAWTSSNQHQADLGDTVIDIHCWHCQLARLWQLVKTMYSGDTLLHNPSHHSKHRWVFLQQEMCSITAIIENLTDTHTQFSLNYNCIDPKTNLCKSTPNIKISTIILHCNIFKHFKQVANFGWEQCTFTFSIIHNMFSYLQAVTDLTCASWLFYIHGQDITTTYVTKRIVICNEDDERVSE